MIRNFTLSMAVLAGCTIGSFARAQSSAAEESSSTGVQAELASYSQNYAAGPQGVGQIPHAMAYGRVWGTAGDRNDSRFYHYPYVFYPQNFQGDEHYRSSNSMYYRYSPQAQIPVYNRHWHNYYPSNRRYHWGHHFILDVF